jgi:uncharacterized protein YyaL (SSP411 family)
MIGNSFYRLHGYIQANRYRGYEFDDFLASPLVRLLCFNHLYLQRVAIQVGKLLPFNIRPLLGIPKLESTKARGFFAKGYLYQYQTTKDEQWLNAADEQLQWLMNHPSTGYPGISWGNAFDFASRGGFFPKGRPTIVWTAHVAESFDLAHKLTGREAYREVVLKAGCFILNGLERHEDERGICFAYSPGILSLVHNSNLLGAAALLRCWQYSKDPVYYDLAQKAYRWTLADMNPDGSWYYGAAKKFQWIDNFHTAYNIDCLLAAYEITDGELIALSVIEKAYDYWTRTFFDADGAPRYYHTAKYPLNIQCAAQAIETLAKLSPHFPTALSLATRVLGWTETHMKKSNGAYLYEIRPYWRNGLECIHWGQSTMLAALGAYCYHQNLSAIPASHAEPAQRALIHR